MINVKAIPNRLQLYTLFTTTLTSFILVLYILEYGSFGIFIIIFRATKVLAKMHKLIVAFNILLIIGALVCNFIASRVIYDMETRVKYEMETKWFWIRFKIIFICMVTFPIEIASWRVEELPELFFIADALKLMCAISFFFILICDRSDIVILLIKKYNEIRDKSGAKDIIHAANESI